MAAYLDTGLLIKIYVNEPDSAQALALVQSLSGPLLFTRFQRAEVVNTLRCKRTFANSLLLFLLWDGCKISP